MHSPLAKFIQIKLDCEYVNKFQFHMGYPDLNLLWKKQLILLNH